MNKIDENRCLVCIRNETDVIMGLSEVICSICYLSRFLLGEKNFS